MKWLKNCSYLLLVLGMGLIYLTFVDGWQVYAKPLNRMMEMYQTAAYGQQAFPGGVVAQGEPGPDDTVDLGGTGQNGSSQGYVSGGDEAHLQESPEIESDSDVEEAVGVEEQPSDRVGSDGKEPVYMTVKDDYFSDAVFIGDSRTVGLFQYGGLEETATFYASTGLTIYKIFDSKIVEVPGQRQKLTVEEALSQNSFRKIYLMIGINEMGTGTVETFTEKYKEAVEHLLELQPEAIVYIQGILKVTTERSEQGDYINNEGITARNEALEQLADNVRIFYLDVNSQICDDTGGVEPSYTFDGVHLKAQYIDIWKDYLKSHAIRLDDGQLSLDDSFV